MPTQLRHTRHGAAAARVRARRAAGARTATRARERVQARRGAGEGQESACLLAQIGFIRLVHTAVRDYLFSSVNQPGANVHPIVRAVDTGRRNVKYIARGEGAEWRCALFPAMAYPCESGVAAEQHGGRRKTIFIPLENLFYEVGPDVHLSADVFSAQMLQHDGYAATPEYLALTLGALHHMQQEAIDLLVVGLPVATFKQRKVVAALEKSLTGVHKVGGKRSVDVRKVLVLAQPQGALMQLGMQQDRLAELRKQRNLIIDAGHRTFDWLVTDGMCTIGKRSNSVDRGMFNVLQRIAEGISASTGANYRDYDAIDRALREKAPLTVYQKEYSVARHLPLARTVCDQAVAEMLHYVGDAADIANIIVVGGASFFFSPAIKRAFPRHRIELSKDAVFANVLGFQMAGVELARTGMAQAGSSP